MEQLFSDNEMNEKNNTDRRLRLPIHYESSPWQKRKKAREQYCEDQNWKCWYCEHDLREKPPSFITEQPFNRKLFPKMFLAHPIHLNIVTKQVCQKEQFMLVAMQYCGNMKVDREKDANI
jgi:hypothetical protein